MGNYLDLRFCSCCVRYRFRSESLVQSPLTVAPSVLTRTLCSNLRTEENMTANIPQSDDPSMGHTEPSFTPGANSVHSNKTPDSCYDDEKNDPKKRSCLQTEHLLGESKIQGVLRKTDPFLQASDLISSPTLRKVLSPNPDLPKDKTYSQNTKFLKGARTENHQDNSLTMYECISGTESGLDQDKNSQTMKEMSPVFKSQMDTMSSTSTTTEQTIYFKSFPSDCHCTLAKASSSSPQASSLPQSKTPPQTDTIPHDDGPIKFSVTYTKSSSTTPQLSSLPHLYPEPRHGLDSWIPFTQTSKETLSVSRPSSLTATTTVTQKPVYSQSSPSEAYCTLGQPSSTHKTQQECPFSDGGEHLPDVHVPISPEPNNISNIKISSSTTVNSNRIISKESHQTVAFLHESLTSTCTQQCVHDSGITPSSPARPAAPPQPQPQAQTQALPQQDNLHVNSHHHPFSSPHLLTPDNDPNICQPMAIREEIRLTPQIQGPPLPAPPSPLPKAQTETLPQGKASKSGPPCITRPLSRATVMKGSPVTLELEVTGQSKPTLTWWVANNQLNNNTQASWDY